ncbi:MAG TPA: protein kinase [Vicinamibacterales bacterium]|nr:protein kinase [Vicinamibacterales bacterium]
MTNARALEPGARVGPYEIVDSIGAGGMGEVYRARDPRLERDVAIKILPHAFAGDAGRLRRFEEEARAASQLNHPNILTVYDVGMHQGIPYIVAELLEGETLRGRLEQGKLSVRKAIEWAHQIAEGLAAAHDKGIVHRDLKPGNVFVTADGRIKILDFGLAKLTRPSEAGHQGNQATETVPGTVLGTAGYMSPEQVRGQPTDRRTDLFSVGAILSEMLSGRPAFTRATAADTTAAVLSEDPAISADVPPSIRQVVFHCVEKDPNARFQSARDLAFDLKSQISSSGMGRRQPARMLAALAAIALVGLALWLGFGRRSAGGTAIGAAGRPAVAVMSFENPSGAADIAWLTHGIPSMLVTGLAQTKGLDVISNSRLEEVVNAAGYGDIAHLDRARWRDVARRAGAGALVGGSVFKAAGSLRLDVSVEEVGSGRVIAAHSVHGAEVFPMVDDVAARIVKGIGVDAAAADTHAIADMTTPSVQAFRLYSEALVARKNLRMADARELLEKAVALDPGFALAYLDLSTATALLKDDAAARKYRALALEHLERLPPRQQMLVQLTTSRTSGDAHKAIDIGERLTTQFPDEAEGFHMLAHAYSDMNESALALKTWEAAIRGAPDAGNLHNEYGYELLQAGRYDEALGQFEDYQRMNPREPNPYDSLGEARLMLGEPERALEAFDTALTIDPQFFQSYAGRAWAFSIQGRYDDALSQSAQFASSLAKRNAPGTTGMLLRAWLLSRVGRYREAAAAAERGRAEAVRFSDTEGQIDADLLTAVVALERGQLEMARAAAARGLTLAPALRDRVGGPARAALRFVAGVAEARAGAVDKARTRAGAARATLAHAGRAERWWQHALEAEIALAGGSAVDAEAALAAAPRQKMWFSLGYGSLTALVNTLPVRDTVARVRLARGDPPGAIAAYRELLTPSRDQQWIGPLEPRFVLGLARLLDQAGDAAGARAQYQRFAALWQGADPGLPELDEARRHLKR